MTEARAALATATREWARYRKAVPGARTAAGDELAAAAREVLAEREPADYWDEGHATDEHGPGNCECRNPHRKYPCLEPGCIKSVEHPRDRHIDGAGRRWWNPQPMHEPMDVES